MPSEKRQTYSEPAVDAGRSSVSNESDSGEHAAEDASGPDMAPAAVAQAESRMGPHTADPSGTESTSSQLPIDPAGRSHTEGPVGGDNSGELAKALDLLRDSVSDLIARKRRTTAAAVSLEMRRRSGKTFTPEAIGFEGFRQFLRFAESVGVVVVLPPVPGGDLEVLASASGSSLAEASTPRIPPRPIRRDLWQAFVDWSPQWQRALDVTTGRVVTLGSNESAEGSDTGQAQHAPDRLRRIIPLSTQDQLSWMKEFAGQLPAGAEKDQLNAALATDRPIAEFTETAKSLGDTHRAWRYYFTNQVTAAITRWMSQEGITVDLYKMPGASREAVHESRVLAGGPSELGLQKSAIPQKFDSSDDLRRQVLEAVARMPLSRHPPTSRTRPGTSITTGAQE